MRCEDFKSNFYEFHDEMLDAGLSDEMERHTEECGECLRMNQRYVNFLKEFSALPDSIQPERDLWDDIRKRITLKDRRPARRIRLFSIAASFVLIIAFSAIMLLQNFNGNPEVRIMKQFDAASKEYANAREELISALHSKEGVLKHETIRIIENNLIIMDQAIGEIKIAIKREPGNRSLLLMLADTYHKETDLLLSTRKLIMNIGKEE